jgi:hypothetical protein
MKLNKYIFGIVLGLTTLTFTSCSNSLDLGPIDYYGSESYWMSEANFNGYIDGLHKNMRDYNFTHQIVFGELRSGNYNSEGTVSMDGMTMASGDIRAQNFDADHTGVSKYADIYGRITNINLFIKKTDATTVLTDAKKSYYLGIAYGLRAFYYYDLYRIYGGAPLRLGIEVIEGELDPNKLYLAQSKPSDVMALIKSDIAKSLEKFGDVTNFDPYSKGKKVYWSKAATEALAADVYLWNSKVTIGDNKLNTADRATAKQYLLNVINNYGLSLLASYSGIFDAKNGKSNNEMIFAIRYAEGEATNNYGQWTYSINTGSLNTKAVREDGTPWNDPLALKTGYNASYQYNTDLFLTYDKNDTRRTATFMPAYLKTDPTKLLGAIAVKNIGFINATGDRIFNSDDCYYRLAWVYLALAEIANDEGINADVEKYINLVRQRAYGTKWSDVYKYTASDYTTNTLAILHEKDKEFVQEGQRWWDLCRMTLTLGGKHLVFCKEGSVKGDYPILDEATQGYKVLWPLDKTILGNDPKLKQTPGYGAAAQQPEQVW